MVDGRGLPVDAVDSYLHWLRATDKSPNTVMSYLTVHDKDERLPGPVQAHLRRSLSAHQVTSCSAMLEVGNRAAAAPRRRRICSSSHSCASAASPAQASATRTGPIRKSYAPVALPGSKGAAE